MFACCYGKGCTFLVWGDVGDVSQAKHTLACFTYIAVMRGLAHLWTEAGACLTVNSRAWEQSCPWCLLAADIPGKLLPSGTPTDAMDGRS